MSILREAERIVDGERGDAYGPPEKDFGRVAKMWSALLGVEVEAWQVGACMICLKLSRETNKHKRDNLVDVAGYAKTIDMIREGVPENDSTVL